jgi:rare lipoprotein A
MTRGVIRQGEKATMWALVKRGRPILVSAILALVAASSGDIAGAQPLGEEGTATVYSKHFEGKKTASGEVYDKKALAAAHPKYAYGTKLRVTNLENGKSAVVTVNDRMKRTAQGVIEVTPRVATSLGFAKAGTARVRVDVVK